MLFQWAKAVWWESSLSCLKGLLLMIIIWLHALTALSTKYWTQHMPQNNHCGKRGSRNGRNRQMQLPEARCPARRMLVNGREWRNNASWSGVAYTTSGSKARLNARWRGRSLAFNTRWRMCFSYKSFTFICFHANFSSFSFVDRQNTYSCKSDLFAN